MERAPVAPRRRRRVPSPFSCSHSLRSLGLAACGDTVGYSEGTGDRIRGKELFVEGLRLVPRARGRRRRAGRSARTSTSRSSSRASTASATSTIQQVVRGQIAYPVDDPADRRTRDARATSSRARTRRTSRPTSRRSRASTRAASRSTRRTRRSPRRPDGGETDGKAIFASAGCGGCHTLADAGSSGTVGPNLDEAKPSKELAVDRVTNGQGGMPSFKGQLSDEQIQAVADVRQLRPQASSGLTSLASRDQTSMSSRTPRFR